eukprot:3758406-Rhodomonas_salina.1
MCGQSVTNPVICPDGVRCCWACAAGASSGCIVTSPVTDKQLDLRWLRMEHVLSSFLQVLLARARSL